MQLRTFLAKDMKAALKSMRDEMGPDAVIVSSERAKGGGVLVRAARDEPEDPVPANEDVPSDFDTAYHGALIRRLREKPGPAVGRRPFDRGVLLSAFARNRLPEALSHALADESAKTGLGDLTLALAAALDARMTAAPIDFAAAKALLLLGPNGAGKTSTAAKLAAHARLAGRPVLLVAGDVAGAGAVARLKDFADHLDARIATAESASSIAAVVAEAVAERMVAIVDTAGFDPRLPKAATAFAALAQIEHIDAVGVLSAATDSEEAAEIAAALKGLGATRLIVTSNDLVRRAGALTAAATTQALAYVTRSPFVAGALEILTPLALARLLVESEAGGAQ